MRGKKMRRGEARGREERRERRGGKRQRGEEMRREEGRGREDRRERRGGAREGEARGPGYWGGGGASQNFMSNQPLQDARICADEFMRSQTTRIVFET